jgi:hypothetical protein
MKQPKNLHTAYATLLAGLVIVVIGAILINQVRYQKNQLVVDSPVPTNPLAASPTPSVTPTPAVSPIPTPSPTPTPTITAAQLPKSATTFLANFYAAYNQADRTRLAAYFSPDTTAELRSLHARLFTGVDPEGNPGGPTLFTTSSAIQKATGYTVVTSALQAGNWIVTVQEQRVDGDGKAISPITTILTLVPSTNPTGSWLIDSYVHTGEVGKYNGFLTQ